MTNRNEREAAITANALSPVRTPAVLAAMSEVELKNLETHLRNLEGADPYGTARKTVPRTAQAGDDPQYTTPYGAPPSGYGIALASRGVAVRQPQPIPPAPAVERVSETSDVYTNPPNGYRIALGKGN